jgi:hypothetical protein
MFRLWLGGANSISFGIPPYYRALVGAPRGSSSCESNVVYAFWDTRTTNLIASFETERDALAFVLSGIKRNGPHDTDTLVLEVEDDQGELVTSLQDQALADRAQGAFGTLAATGE